MARVDEENNQSDSVQRVACALRTMYNRETWLDMHHSVPIVKNFIAIGNGVEQCRCHTNMSNNDECPRKHRVVRRFLEMTGGMERRRRGGLLDNLGGSCHRG